MKKNTLGGIMGMLLIGLFFAAVALVGYGKSSTENANKQACIEKLKTIPELEGCEYADAEAKNKNFIECSCVKDSKIEKYAVTGKEIPK